MTIFGWLTTIFLKIFGYLSQNLAIFVQMIDLFRPKNLFFMNFWVDWQKWAISGQIFLPFLTNLYIFANYQSGHSRFLDVDSNSEHCEHHSKAHENGGDHRQRKVLRERSHIFRFRHLLQKIFTSCPKFNISLPRRKSKQMNRARRSWEIRRWWNTSLGRLASCKVREPCFKNLKEKIK